MMRLAHSDVEVSCLIDLDLDQCSQVRDRLESVLFRMKSEGSVLNRNMKQAVERVSTGCQVSSNEAVGVKMELN